MKYFYSSLRPSVLPGCLAEPPAPVAYMRRTFKGLISLCNFTTSSSHIRKLTNCATFKRIVTEMYTERDPRGERERPRAAAILLSFWHHHLRQAIQDLRTIFIPVVTDDSMDAVRQQIYGRMGLELGQRLVIRRGGEPGERDAFKKVSSKTKFGRCVRLIEEHNQAMKEAEIKVSAFKFNPRDEGGFYYDFVVEFRASSRHHQGGHRTSRRSSDPRRR